MRGEKSVSVRRPNRGLYCAAPVVREGGGGPHKQERRAVCLPVEHVKPQTPANLALKIASKNCENVREPLWVLVMTKRGRHGHDSLFGN
jgi:hypothetical protein